MLGTKLGSKTWVLIIIRLGIQNDSALVAGCRPSLREHALQSIGVNPDAALKRGNISGADLKRRYHRLRRCIDFVCKRQGRGAPPFASGVEGTVVVSNGNSQLTDLRDGHFEALRRRVVERVRAVPSETTGQGYGESYLITENQDVARLDVGCSPDALHKASRKVPELFDGQG